MKFARWSFLLAALYGLTAIGLSIVMPTLTAATFSQFAFAGAAGATQPLYLLIATDPHRYRATIPVGIASKLSFATPAFILYAQGTAPPLLPAFAAIDLALAALFAINFVRLGRTP